MRDLPLLDRLVVLCRVNPSASAFVTLCLLGALAAALVSLFQGTLSWA